MTLPMTLNSRWICALVSAMHPSSAWSVRGRNGGTFSGHRREPTTFRAAFAAAAKIVPASGAASTHPACHPATISSEATEPHERQHPGEQSQRPVRHRHVAYRLWSDRDVPRSPVGATERL